MKTTRLLLLAIAVLVAACSGAPASPSGAGGGDASAGPASSLQPDGSVEIRQYSGVDLSAVSDIRDTSIAGAQQVSLDKYLLRVTGLVKTPLELTYDQVLANAHYSRVVTLVCVEGWDATILWEGVRLEDVLAPAGVLDGAPVVIFHAVDGYTSSLPLAFIRANHIMLAFRMNGLTLTPERGFPFQVVAESKWGYKWVKWVDGIELSNDTGYRGYWETEGYNRDGELTGPMFEP
jgi:DMSO/TMAO reductase YedYZ molybdopterin-dependent catalytic subunit